MVGDYPRLCGGTFFVLLTNAKTNKKTSIGYNKSFAEGELMYEIAKVFNEQQTKSDSFKSRTNSYKFCTTSVTTTFDFTRNELISDFDKAIKENYLHKAKLMEKVVKTYLSIESEPIIKQLVKSILDLIKHDNSIEPKDVFYIKEDGNKVTKTELLLLDEFNLPCFLLGIFHYIICNRQDNLVGKNTIQQWFPTKENKSGKKHEFQSNIGSNYKDIKVIITLNDTEETTTYTPLESTSDKQRMDDGYTVGVIPQPNSSVTYINTQFNITQAGTGTNIAHVDKVEIIDGNVVVNK